MKERTVIDEISVKIQTRNESVKGLDLSQSKKVSFLPVQVADIFPNLIAISAWDCSIKTILKKNFARLIKLQQLCIDHNQIETIHSEIFEDLISLEVLTLCITLCSCSI
jgi:Leucine-rich repeat (LRR) protein